MSIKLQVSQILHNLYRDITKFPINRAKVDALKESIQQTDFWDNLLCRPAGNETIAGLSAMTVGYNDEGPLFEVELAYGHHRLVAIQELGIETISIPVKQIDDKTMLKIMANENKGDWAGDMSVILETVRQARKFLAETVEGFADYKAYTDAGETFFSKDAFAQIPAQGVGFKSIQKFLGETWSAQDIRKTVSVLKDIDAGLYEQEQIITFPSIGVLGGFSKLAGAIGAQNWPDFFKEVMVNDIAGLISDPKVSTTVKILTSATEAAKNSKDPVKVIQNPGQKRKDFNPVQAIKARVYENMDPNTLLKLEDLPEIDGFKDYPELDKVIEEVKKSINRSEAAKQAAETGTAVVTEDGEEITPEMAGDTEALEAMISNAEAEIGVDAAPDTLGSVPAEDLVVGEGTVVSDDTLVQTLQVANEQLAVFVQQIDEGATVESEELPVIIEAVTRNNMMVFFQLFGKDDFTKMAKEVIAAFAEEV